MHLYKNKKNRISGDRPQGVNVPGTPRRLIKVTSGDTLAFTANVTVPSTGEPVRNEDLDTTDIYIAVAENRFSPVMWSGSTLDRWIVLDENRNGLIHIVVPRTLTDSLRRGSYAFSVVVDDGIVRETQLVGNFQIEYEPTGAINDIPYRSDQDPGAPVSLTPEIDLASQEHHRLTRDQLMSATATVARTLLGVSKVSDIVFGSCDHDPTNEEEEYAVHRLSQLIIYDDTLRAKIVSVTCDEYDPTNDEFVDHLCYLLDKSGLGWKTPPCRPSVSQ